MRNNNQKLVLGVLALVVILGLYECAHVSQAAVPSGRRVGFWMQEDSTWPTSPYGANPTPQQFFDGYFLTPPYPAAMYWNTGMYLDGGSAVAQAQWLSEVAGMADHYPNIKIIVQLFINLSNFSVISGTHYVPFGFGVKRSNYQTTFTLTTLAPSTAYTLALQDFQHNPITTITAFTTNSTGGWKGTVPIPNVPNYGYSYYNQHYFIFQVLGTTLYAELYLTTDATTDFTNYMNAIRGHPSIIGAQFEPEFFGAAPYITNKFDSIVTAAGYTPVVTTNGQGPWPILYFSQYPYFNGVLSTNSVPGPNQIGIDYGETGGPDCVSSPCPAWSQAVVQNIVEKSTPNPMTILNCVADKNNPAGTNNLFSSATLRGWIWNDPYYKANYLLANGVTTSNTTSSTSFSSSSSSTVQSSPSSATLYTTSTSSSSISAAESTSVSSSVSIGGGGTNGTNWALVSLVPVIAVAGGAYLYIKRRR